MFDVLHAAGLHVRLLLPFRFPHRPRVDLTAEAQGSLVFDSYR